MRINWSFTKALSGVLACLAIVSSAERGAFASAPPPPSFTTLQPGGFRDIAQNLQVNIVLVGYEQGAGPQQIEPSLEQVKTTMSGPGVEFEENRGQFDEHFWESDDRGSVTLSGSVSGTTTTASDGRFYFGDTVAGGNHIVAAAENGFAFLPSSFTINPLNTNQDLIFVGQPTN